MSVLTKADLLQKVKEIVGDDTSDNVLNFLGDLDDTISDFEKKSNDNTDWKTKYEENDKSWREKYRDRFLQGSDHIDEQSADKGKSINESEQTEPQLKNSYDELFEKKGD